MKKRIVISLAAAFIAAAALIYLYFTGEGEGSGIPCLFYKFSGLFCSGCGASRALRSVLHLDFYQAIRYNAFFTLMLPLLGGYFCALLFSYIRYGKDKISGKIPMKALMILIAVAIIFGILRNIPAFSFLAPTVL